MATRKPTKRGSTPASQTKKPAVKKLRSQMQKLAGIKPTGISAEDKERLSIVAQQALKAKASDSIATELEHATEVSAPVIEEMPYLNTELDDGVAVEKNGVPITHFNTHDIAENINNGEPPVPEYYTVKEALEHATIKAAWSKKVGRYLHVDEAGNIQAKPSTGLIHETFYGSRLDWDRTLLDTINACLDKTEDNVDEHKLKALDPDHFAIVVPKNPASFFRTDLSNIASWSSALFIRRTKELNGTDTMLLCDIEIDKQTGEIFVRRDHFICEIKIELNPPSDAYIVAAGEYRFGSSSYSSRFFLASTTCVYNGTTKFRDINGIPETLSGFTFTLELPDSADIMLRDDMHVVAFGEINFDHGSLSAYKGLCAVKSLSADSYHGVYDPAHTIINTKSSVTIYANQDLAKPKGLDTVCLLARVSTNAVDTSTLSANQKTPDAIRTQLLIEEHQNIAEPKEVSRSTMLSRAQRYAEYDKMESSASFLYGTALDIYASNVCLHDGSNAGHVLKIESDNEDITEALETLFYVNLDIDMNLQNWVRSLCKYGDSVLLLSVSETRKGVTDAVQIPPIEMQRMELYDPTNGNKKSVKFHIQRSTSPSSCEEMKYWNVAHFRLTSNGANLPYGVSILESARSLHDSIRLEGNKYAPEHLQIVATALRIPKAYMNFDEAIQPRSDLAVAEALFAKEVENIQRHVVSELYKIAVIHLSALGFSDSEIDTFTLQLTSPRQLNDPPMKDMFANEYARKELIKQFRSEKVVEAIMTAPTVPDCPSLEDAMSGDESNTLHEVAEAIKLKEQDTSAPFIPVDAGHAPLIAYIQACLGGETLVTELSLAQLEASIQDAELFANTKKFFCASDRELFLRFYSLAVASRQLALIRSKFDGTLIASTQMTSMSGGVKQLIDFAVWNEERAMQMTRGNNTDRH